MPGLRRRSSHNWFAPILSRGPAALPGGMSAAFIMAVRAALVLCAVMIAFMRWYLVDTSDNYMVGYPSPRTYPARIATRFVDRALTNESRHMAADQIVNVRVRNRSATQLVTNRIANLKNGGDTSFAPPLLEEIIRAMPDGARAAVISTAVEIAEKNYDKAVTRSEQTSIILDSLKSSPLPQADKNVVQQLLDALLVPTVNDDSEMADRLREDVASHIPSFTRDIQIGRDLVQQGQTVTPETARLLRENGYPDATVPWKHLGFVITVTFAWSVWVTWIGLNLESPPSRREWIYVVVLLVIDWMAQNATSR
ncbi:MAG: hypothetical protein LBU26_00395, partial [Synergistaceae bacterium]|nr:hypothetical protein [Synergistaceae bacterium]